jgi:hypothetical protein
MAVLLLGHLLFVAFHVGLREGVCGEGTRLDVPGDCHHTGKVFLWTARLRTKYLKKRKTKVPQQERKKQREMIGHNGTLFAEESDQEPGL